MSHGGRCLASDTSAMCFVRLGGGVGPTKKRKWTDLEDNSLVSSVQKFGTSNWSVVAVALPGRSGKQCRERWTNQLDPGLNREDWTPQEDATLVFHQNSCGNCWAKMTAFLPRRSSNSIKNRWCWLMRNRSHLSREVPPPPPAAEPSLEPCWPPGLWGEALDLPVAPEFFENDMFDPPPSEWSFLAQKDLMLDKFELCGATGEFSWQ
jgi:hypothetical protein